jgi:hypothetical protein
MPTMSTRLVIPALMTGAFFVPPAVADTFFFSTGDPDGKMATAARPSSPGKFEIESADDFVLTSPTDLTSATFTGLLTGNATVSDVVVEIYRVFPADSNVGRTSGPPTFSTAEVPTRVNSPADVEVDDRNSASGNLSFTTPEVAASFTAANSVQPGGIHPIPNQATGGNGPITGKEVRFNVTFTTPFDLPADHFFFVPQVEVADPNGNFFWLSAPKPIVPPGTPFPAGFTDLQEWTRDDISPNNLDPDWLRVGTDIVGGDTPPTFNATFSITGNTVPESSTWAMMLLGFAGLGFAAFRSRKRDTAIASE